MSSLELERRPPDWRSYLAAYERTWQQHITHPTEQTLQLLEIGQEILIRELFKPGKFELGQLGITPGAQDALLMAGHITPEFLLRHKHGDWGDLGPDDLAENERALHKGSRLFSRYHTRREDNLWIITEWDRSVTTLLLPEEY